MPSCSCRMSPDIGDLKEFFHITDDSTQVCFAYVQWNEC